MCVRLLGLPLEFWHEEIFKGIAESFGELMAIDNMIASRSKIHCARIYVKVVHPNDLPQKVKINSKLGKWNQEVSFEDLPNMCFICKKLGH